MAAVESALGNVVMAWRALNERSEARFGTAHMTGNSNVRGAGTGFVKWSVPFGALTPTIWTGIQGQRYMTRYGVTNEDLANVSVALRAETASNPRAWFYGKPIAKPDHRQSRWAVE